MRHLLLQNYRGIRSKDKKVKFSSWLEFEANLFALVYTKPHSFEKNVLLIGLNEDRSQISNMNFGRVVMNGNSSWQKIKKLMPTIGIWSKGGERSTRLFEFEKLSDYLK